MCGEHVGETLVGAVSLCRHHHPRCVLVEPVDNAGPHDSANAGQARAAMCDQCVDQRAGWAARGRMDDHSGCLVDDDKMFILKQDIQRDGFALRCWIAWFGDRQLIDGAGSYAC